MYRLVKEAAGAGESAVDSDAPSSTDSADMELRLRAEVISELAAHW